MNNPGPGIRCEIKREASGLFSLDIWSIGVNCAELAKTRVHDDNRFWTIEEAKSYVRQTYGLSDREISSARQR